jgi:hypothetical protein
VAYLIIVSHLLVTFTIAIMMQRLLGRWVSAFACDWDDGQEHWERSVEKLLDKPAQTNEKPNLSISLVQQTETWDCGIACLLTALRWISNEPEHPTILTPWEESIREWMIETSGTKSIWSMDLVHLLHELKQNKGYKFNYLFASKALEVDDSHRQLEYYRRAFQEDKARVAKLFQTAQEEGWPMLQVTGLDFSKLLNLVKRPDCIAIVLVDNSILRQKIASSYSGHYVVLSGVVELGHGAFDLQIHNPARSEHEELVSSALFEKAWRAKGTDDDVIFLVKI